MGDVWFVGKGLVTLGIIIQILLSSGRKERKGKFLHSCGSVKSINSRINNCRINTLSRRTEGCNRRKPSGTYYNIVFFSKTVRANGHNKK